MFAATTQGAEDEQQTKHIRMVITRRLRNYQLVLMRKYLLKVIEQEL